MNIEQEKMIVEALPSLYPMMQEFEEDAIHTVLDALPHWIPVTERLPEKTGKYLAWAVVSFIPDHVDEPNTIKQIAIASYSTRTRTWFGDNVEDVIAWMPLPEPFKGATT